MSAAAPRIDFLLRRLILLAGEVRDQLALGDWEHATAAREEYDEAFAAFQARVDGGDALTLRHASDVAQLRRVHLENQLLAEQLRRKVGAELEDVARVRRIAGYAPLGSNHKPAPRYIDGSA